MGDDAESQRLYTNACGAIINSLSYCMGVEDYELTLDIVSSACVTIVAVLSRNQLVCISSFHYNSAIEETIRYTLSRALSIFLRWLYTTSPNSV